MSAFAPGQLVRVVWASMPYLVGRLVELDYRAPGPVHDGRLPHSFEAWATKTPHPYWIREDLVTPLCVTERQIEAVVDDGRQLVSWDQCAWQPPQTA